MVSMLRVRIRLCLGMDSVLFGVCGAGAGFACRGLGFGLGIPWGMGGVLFGVHEGCYDILLGCTRIWVEARYMDDVLVRSLWSGCMVWNSVWAKLGSGLCGALIPWLLTRDGIHLLLGWNFGWDTLAVW